MHAMLKYPSKIICKKDKGCSKEKEYLKDNSRVTHAMTNKIKKEQIKLKKIVQRISKNFKI